MKYSMMALLILLGVASCNSHENDPIQKQEEAPVQEPRGANRP